MQRLKSCSRNPPRPLQARPHPHPPLRQPNSILRSSPSRREIKAMTKTLNISRVLSLGLVAFGIMLIGGLTNAVAQRDPFEKPGYARPKTPGAPKLDKNGKPIPVEDWSVPS